MRTHIILLVCLFLLKTSLHAQVNRRHVYVKPYIKSNGTVVEGHYRTAPNSTNRDNFSTRPNTNPYTGRDGTVAPDNKSLYNNNSGYYSYPTDNTYPTNSAFPTRNPSNTTSTGSFPQYDYGKINHTTPSYKTKGQVKIQGHIVYSSKFSVNELAKLNRLSLQNIELKIAAKGFSFSEICYDTVYSYPNGISNEKGDIAYINKKVFYFFRDYYQPDLGNESIIREEIVYISSRKYKINALEWVALTQKIYSKNSEETSYPVRIELYNRDRNLYSTALRTLPLLKKNFLRNEKLQDQNIWIFEDIIKDLRSYIQIEERVSSWDGSIYFRLRF